MRRDAGDGLFSGRGVLCLAAGFVLLLPALAPAGDAGSESARARAFIRVFGDLQVEFAGARNLPDDQQNVEVATGSGFVIAPSGLVLTSHNLVDDAPYLRSFGGLEAELRIENRRIEVTLGVEGARVTFEAHVVATDPELDLAVLQVTAHDLPYVRFGDSGVLETTGARAGRHDEGVEAGRTLGADFEGVEVESADEDGYALAVGSVPINRVKDFLDASGLLGQVPVERLWPGVVHALDWKGLRIELPDGFGDSWPGRLLVDTGESGSTVSFFMGRVATPWNVEMLQQRLLQRRAWPGFLPGTALGQRESEVARRRVLGSAFGEAEDGRPFRVEYALLDLGPEKIVARYLGRPDDLAFNLSLVRRSLETLQAAPLLTAPVESPLRAGFEPVGLRGGPASGVPLPSGWAREPAAYASCARVPAAEAGVAASPVGDFTVVFRALRWAGSAIVPEDVARACGQASGTPGARYAGRFDRLGVGIGAWGTFVRRPGEVLLLEAEAPEAKLPFVRDLYVDWLHRVVGSD